MTGVGGDGGAASSVIPVCAYKTTWCHIPGDSPFTAVRTSDLTI
jgi:hypothetical protein